MLQAAQDAHPDRQVRPAFKVRMHLRINPQHLGDHNRWYRPGEIRDQVKFIRIDFSKHPLHNFPGPGTPFFHCTWRKGFANERAKASVVRFIHHQHGWFFIAPPQELPGKGPRVRVWLLRRLVFSDQIPRVPVRPGTQPCRLYR